MRIVCVDPRRTRSSAELADEHVFIRPSTDAAALIAMAYVIASEGLHDQAYCDRSRAGLRRGPPAARCAGGCLLRCVSGSASPDGVQKTPEWAADITGMPAETIRRLAIEFATTKPAALQCGYAPGRTAYGEQFHRAAYALAAITGNVGIAGGNSGVSNGATGRTGIKSLPAGANPIPRAGRLADARRPADAGQGGRLPRRHQDDLLGRRRPLQPVPQRQQDRAARSTASSSCRAGPLPHAHRPLRRHRAAGHDLLGAQRRAHAVGGRGALRDLHEAGDRADVRVPQRHRHLRRPRRAVSASRATTTRARWTGCAS